MQPHPLDYHHLHHHKGYGHNATYDARHQTDESIAYRIRFLNNTKCEAIYEQLTSNGNDEKLQQKYASCLLSGLSTKMRKCLLPVEQSFASATVTEEELKTIDSCMKQETREVEHVAAKIRKMDYIFNTLPSFAKLQKNVAKHCHQDYDYEAQAALFNKLHKGRQQGTGAPDSGAPSAKEGICAEEAKSLHYCEMKQRTMASNDEWMCFIPRTKHLECIASAICASKVRECQMRMLAEEQRLHPSDQTERVADAKAKYLIPCLSEDDSVLKCTSDFMLRYGTQKQQERTEKAAVSYLQFVNEAEANFDALELSDAQYAEQYKLIMKKGCGAENLQLSKCLERGSQCRDEITKSGACVATHLCLQQIKECMAKSESNSAAALGQCITNYPSVTACLARLRDPKVANLVGQKLEKRV